MERLMTENEAAEKLGMTSEGLRGLRKKNNGPDYIRVGRLVRYDENDLEKWVEQNRVSA